jgi:hypothetical protein
MHKQIQWEITLQLPTIPHCHTSPSADLLHFLFCFSVTPTNHHNWMISTTPNFWRPHCGAHLLRKTDYTVPLQQWRSLRNVIYIHNTRQGPYNGNFNSWWKQPHLHHSNYTVLAPNSSLYIRNTQNKLSLPLPQFLKAPQMPNIHKHSSESRVLTKVILWISRRHAWLILPLKKVTRR